MCREGGEKECPKLSKCLKCSECLLRGAYAREKGRVLKGHKAGFGGRGQRNGRAGQQFDPEGRIFWYLGTPGKPCWNIFRSLILEMSFPASWLAFLCAYFQCIHLLVCLFLRTYKTFLGITSGPYLLNTYCVTGTVLTYQTHFWLQIT